MKRKKTLLEVVNKALKGEPTKEDMRNSLKAILEEYYFLESLAYDKASEEEVNKGNFDFMLGEKDRLELFRDDESVDDCDVEFQLVDPLPTKE